MTTIACIGGGPSGLLAAILLKQADAASDVRIYERQPCGSLPGWGIVLPAVALHALAAADEESASQLNDACTRWDRIDVHFRSRVVSSRGHDYASLSRQTLLRCLGARADALGIDRLFGCEILGLDALRDHNGLPNLIVAADGAKSRLRQSLADRFLSSETQGRTRFLWLGTTRVADAFSFVFAETRWGWFQAHVFPLDAETSTFIVETLDVNWRDAGLGDADMPATIRFCEDIFGSWLDGASLLAASSSSQDLIASPPLWRCFSHLSNQSLVYENTVLIGDAAHAVHFSIGAGTRLAIEDAVALRDAFVVSRHDVPRTLARYQEQRREAVLKLQSAARNSTHWLENVRRYAAMDPTQFAYSLLTRSQRLGHAELRRRDAESIDLHERWLANRVLGDRAFENQGQNEAAATPPAIGENRDLPAAPMFLPFWLRELRLANRVVVSPMATYSANDGTIGDFHLVHLGARALGGAGLLITEMTAVSPAARITPGCAGLYRPEHVAAWRRVTDFVHGQSAAKICLQLGHAGPKGSTKLGWKGMDEPLESGGWPVIGASPIRWQAGHAAPRAMDSEDMGRVCSQFVSATRHAIDAGFDMIELHAAHGYLLSAFVTPLTNKRTDDYGGSLANRLRFPIEVFSAMRAVWPAERPMSVRISACDWAEGGIDPEDSTNIAQAFREAGADLIDVSTGQTSVNARPIYGRMYQTPFSDRIRNETGIATMAVGNITEPDQINTIIAAGRADLCALGRPHLADPHFTLRAAASADFKPQAWPKPYLAARPQFEKLLRQAAEPGV